MIEAAADTIVEGPEQFTLNAMNPQADSLAVSLSAPASSVQFTIQDENSAITASTDTARTTAAHK